MFRFGRAPELRPNEEEWIRFYIDEHLRPRCETLRAQLHNDPASARQAWTELIRSFFNEAAPYWDACWWYLRQTFSDAELARAELEMLPFPDYNPAPAAAWPINHDKANCCWDDEHREQLRWWVRYVRGLSTAPHEHTRAALILLCDARACTAEELASWLDRKARTIREHLAALVEEGRLSASSDGRYSGAQPIDAATAEASDYDSGG